MDSRRRFFPLLLILAVSGAAQESPPVTERFAARDFHQGVTVAARLLTDAAEAKALFGENAAPVRAGLLAVELLIENQREAAIAINVGRIVLLRNGDKFHQTTPEEAALLLYPLPEGRQPNLSPQPIPLPRRSPLPKDKKRKEREEAEASLASRRFRTRSIPAAGQARGFLYFDLGEVEAELGGMQLYVPEVDDAATGEGLLYFEVALTPAGKP
jgi:hypothetical protein